MQGTTVRLPEIKLIGISARTSYTEELSWETGKIFPCVQQYFHHAIAEQIPNREKPGTTLCAYTDYESDYTGAYTYFIGEAVTSFENMPEGLARHIIPSQTYIQFENGPGAMPEVVREPWQKIWQMSPEMLGGERAYLTDFELYDERAADHQNIIFDIYIGIDA